MTYFPPDAVTHNFWPLQENIHIFLLFMSGWRCPFAVVVGYFGFSALTACGWNGGYLASSQDAESLLSCHFPVEGLMPPPPSSRVFLGMDCFCSWLLALTAVVISRF